MHILHTEASTGWGGQEIRILREAKGMRERGHSIVFAVAFGARLGARAKEEGFQVYNVDFSWKSLAASLVKLVRVIRKEKIDIINTHSSLDAWIGGIAGKLAGIKLIRTRHLSTPSKPGLNSRILYHHLSNFTVTTCESVAEKIRSQARIGSSRCRSIPTGVELNDPEPSNFREEWGISPDEIVIGTACILRSWKGISDLLKAANLLKDYPSLTWLVVGSGPSEERFKQECRELKLEDRVIFTGFLPDPLPAIGAMDIFTLLSTGNEGVSQASLQAAFLKKPLITTHTGGLPEVCLPGKTGYLTSSSPEEIASAFKKLIDSPEKRELYGQNAHILAKELFSFDKTLNEMEKVYEIV